jgi:hypothetical protein
LGHIGGAGLKRLLSQHPDLANVKPITHCIGCESGHKTRTRFLKGKSIDKSQVILPGERIDVDIMGPFRITSTRGNRYILTIVDKGSGFCYAETMKRKSDSNALILGLVAKIERITGKRIKIIRSDKAKELKLGPLDHYCIQMGITQQSTEGYNSKQNATVERYTRQIMSIALSFLHHIHGKIPLQLWDYMFETAAYVYNRWPILNGSISHYESFYGYTPRYERLRIIGSNASYWINPDKRHILESKARHGLLLGYGANSDFYVIWDPSQELVVETQHYHIISTACMNLRASFETKQQTHHPTESFDTKLAGSNNPRFQYC